MFFFQQILYFFYPKKNFGEIFGIFCFFSVNSINFANFWGKNMANFFYIRKIGKKKIALSI